MTITPNPPAPSGPNETPAEDAPAAPEHGHGGTRGDLLKLTLGALGVVYGDIGTSPLYAVKECFHHSFGLEPNAANALGVLSLIFWSLALVVVVKYLTFVMRADNQGDGGILALLALVSGSGSGPEGGRTRGGSLALVLVGLFGASLLWADGMITPVISVLGAMEGLQVVAPALEPLVVPLSIVILIALFLLQRRGTAGIGAIFGPVMLVWFATLGALGIPWILREPAVLQALNPVWGLELLARDGLRGFLVLGGVVLCVTGAEALYADMGHFGRGPIRIAWYAVVFPGLLLNYFGQVAMLMVRGPEVIANPFYLLAPSWFVVPLLVLATAAAVIASQALISGAFSLAQQTVQLGYAPRLTIVHTSERVKGQIYVPAVDKFLLVACVALTLAFRNTSNLAAAYGIAVVGTMTATTLLLAAVARTRWGWGWPAVGTMTAAMLAIDLSFLSANLNKILHGGWLPLVVGVGIYLLMTTWKKGRALLAAKLQRESLPTQLFMQSVASTPPHRVSGTAVFMTSNVDVAPVVLLHHFKHNKVLHEQVLFLTIVTAATPTVPRAKSVSIEALGHGFYKVVAHYGFMQAPSIVEVIERCAQMGLDVTVDGASFFLGNESLLTTGRSGLPGWRKALFGLMSRNARPARAFFGIPPNRVIELGIQIEI